MPFGSDPFRDADRAIESDKKIEKCHQCLSAVIPFGTTNFWEAITFVVLGVTNAFRQ